MLFCMTSSLAVYITASAVTPEAKDNPYQSIVDRNVFALKPPPPPPDPEATKAPPVKITLTGITTILGNKRALMKAPAPPGKPGEPAKPELSFILAPGQRDGDVEVLDIDEVAGNVKLRNGGVEVTLNIDKDGPKLAPSPAPGVPGIPGAVPPVPGIGRTVTPAAPGANPGFTMPTRTLRLPPAGGGVGNTGSVSPGGIGAGMVPGINPGYGATPQNLSSGQPQRSWPPESNVSLEEQTILMEAQKQAGRVPAALFPVSGNPGSETPANPQTPNTPTLPRPPGSPPLPQ